ncbi:MAG TPA: TolC family protein, partial [Candidatus Acidoferrales bacterium]|nr:TolC family protein [Candidatus Acidoferrales bacterium]
MKHAYPLISKISLSGLLLILALEGCTVGSKYKGPPATALAPFHNQVDDAANKSVTVVPLDRWWAGFNDPMLATVVQRALDQNLDLAAALARVNRARAAAAGAGAQLLPTTEFGATATAER